MCHFGFVFFFIYIDCSDSFVDNLTLAVRDSIVWLSLSNGECRDSLHWQVGDTQTIENTCERAGLKLFCKHEDTFRFWFSIPPIVADFLTVDRLLSVCTKITLVCCVFYKIERESTRVRQQSSSLSTDFQCVSVCSCVFLP